MGYYERTIRVWRCDGCGMHYNEAPSADLYDDKLKVSGRLATSLGVREVTGSPSSLHYNVADVCPECSRDLGVALTKILDRRKMLEANEGTVTLQAVAPLDPPPASLDPQPEPLSPQQNKLLGYADPVRLSEFGASSEWLFIAHKIRDPFTTPIYTIITPKE